MRAHSAGAEERQRGAHAPHHAEATLVDRPHPGIVGQVVELCRPDGPAAFTRMLSDPHRSPTSANAASTAAASVMSARRPSTSGLPAAAQLGAGLVDRRLRARQHRNPRAVLGEATGRGPTHSARAALHHRRRVREPEIHVVSSVVVRGSGSLTAARPARASDLRTDRFVRRAGGERSARGRRPHRRGARVGDRPRRARSIHRPGLRRKLRARSSPDADDESGQLRCDSCRVEFAANEAGRDRVAPSGGRLRPRRHARRRRAAMCPRCSTRGSLVLNYGPTATPEDAAALLASPTRRRCALSPTRRGPPSSSSRSRATSTSPPPDPRRPAVRPRRLRGARRSRWCARR